MLRIFLKTISGLNDINIEVPNDISTSELDLQLKSRLPLKVSSKSIIALTNGLPILKYGNIQEIPSKPANHGYLVLHIRIPICGGKGGFGSSLKKKATKKSGRSNDNYKTLDGYKVKYLKKIAYLEKHSSDLTKDQKAKMNEKREKLMKILEVDPEAVAKKDAKFDDHRYLEDLDDAMREIQESVGIVMDLDSDSSDDAEDEDDYDGDLNKVESGDDSHKKSESKHVSKLTDKAAESDPDSSEDESEGKREPIKSRLDSFFNDD